MKIIKNKVRTAVNNEWLNDMMICYTERVLFKSVDDKDVIRTFTAMMTQKGHLPCDFV